MIVCATPRCGGTIFCITKAAEIGATFIGELSAEYITGMGRYRDIKQKHHETSFQPTFALDDYLEHLHQINAPDKIYLINESVSLALPASSFRIATRNLDRAFRSMADLVIRATGAMPPDIVFNNAARLCRAQLESNVLIRRYCEVTGKPLIWFEDQYKSKDFYPHFDAFSKRERLENLFEQLGNVQLQQLGRT